MVSVTGWRGVKELVNIVDMDDEVVSLQYADGMIARVDKRSFITRFRPEAICEYCLKKLKDGKCPTCSEEEESQDAL